MSLPNEVDFALVKAGDGGGTEVFTIFCGQQDATVNAAANSSDRFVRDCAKPGEIPYRKVKASGRQMDVTFSGFTDKTQIAAFNTKLGKVGNYKIELYQDDGTDAGVLIGTYSAAFMLTGHNQTIPREGQASVEGTLKSHGSWTWTAAP